VPLMDPTLAQAFPADASAEVDGQIKNASKATAHKPVLIFCWRTWLMDFMIDSFDLSE